VDTVLDIEMSSVSSEIKLLTILFVQKVNNQNTTNNVNSYLVLSGKLSLGELVLLLVVKEFKEEKSNV